MIQVDARVARREFLAAMADDDAKDRPFPYEVHLCMALGLVIAMILWDVCWLALCVSSGDWGLGQAAVVVSVVMLGSAVRQCRTMFRDIDEAAVFAQRWYETIATSSNASAALWDAASRVRPELAGPLRRFAVRIAVACSEEGYWPRAPEIREHDGTIEQRGPGGAYVAVHWHQNCRGETWLQARGAHVRPGSILLFGTTHVPWQGETYPDEFELVHKIRTMDEEAS